MRARVVVQLFIKLGRNTVHDFYFLDISAISFFSLIKMFLKFSEDSHVKKTLFYGLIP